MLDVHERWIDPHLISHPVDTVATRAAHRVKLCAPDAFATRRLHLYHRENPRHLIAIDVKDAVRIVRGTAPFAASVKPREDDGAFRAWRLVLSARSHLHEALEQVFVLVRDPIQ